MIEAIVSVMIIIAISALSMALGAVARELNNIHADIDRISNLLYLQNNYLLDRDVSWRDRTDEQQ